MNDLPHLSKISADFEMKMSCIVYRRSHSMWNCCARGRWFNAGSQHIDVTIQCFGHL